jgi:hypothetical protein
MWRLVFLLAGCALDAGPNEPYPVLRIETIGEPRDCFVTVNVARCGVDCEVRLPPETEVTLDVVPPGCPWFAGWDGGGCSGRFPCAFRLTEDVTIQASFY